MQPEEITLADVRRLNVKPGETLAVTLAWELDPDEMATIKAHVEQMLPGVTVLVLTPVASLDVIAA